MQNRFKSWPMWLSVAGAVWTVLSAFGVTDQIGLTNDVWNTVLNAIGAVLVAFGIVNNPTSKNSL